MAATHQAVPDVRNADVRIYVNGELVPRADAKVSVFDSGFLVGDGIWEGVRLHNGTLIHLDRHLDRMFAGAAQVGLDIGLTRSEMIKAIEDTLAVNDMTTGVHVRIMVTRGVKKTPAQHPDLVVGGPTMVIIAEHKNADPAVAEAGITLATSAVRRPPPETLDQRLNCHSKLHEIAALVEANRAGADEALMLDVNDNVATCNATNFFIVTGGELWTSTGLHCLNGITRGVVIELAAELGITVRQRDFRLEHAHGADEAFVTGTFGGITSVVEIDGHPIGATLGPITTLLVAAYQEHLDELGATSD